MLILADVYIPALEGVISQMGDIQSDLDLIIGYVIALIGVAGTIWISALVWRKFKETTNKV